MKYEHKDNTGSMWFSVEKKSEKSPDFKGDMKLEGKLYFVSGWNRVTNGGKEYISLMVKIKDPNAAPYVEPGAVPKQPEANPRPEPNPDRPW